LDLAARLLGEKMPVQIDWKTGAPAPWHALQSLHIVIY
jgi:hypothetical protein